MFVEALPLGGVSTSLDTNGWGLIVLRRRSEP
jgi:hypothetical protein